MSGLLASLLGNRASREKLRGLLGNVSDFAGNPVGYTQEALAQALPTMEEAMLAAKDPANVDINSPYGQKMMGLAGLLGSIKVYHGSPHSFTKPDSSKIGTGEGAQSYGHGLYWAENPSVAVGYKNKLSYVDQVRQFRKELPDDASFEELLDLANSGKLSANSSRVIKELANDDWLGFDYPSQAISAAFRDRKNFSDMSPSLKKALDEYGNLYEANLRWPNAAREAADPLSVKHFLDWDKPLYRQSKEIRRAVSDLVDKEYGQGTYKEWLKTNRPDFKDLRSNMFDSKSEKWLSNELKNRNIPGIAYLDAGSRAAGQGTRNYVTFDDALVELLKRNGGLLGK